MVVPHRICHKLLKHSISSFLTRINYGTDHKTNFLEFFYRLAWINLIKEEDYPDVVTGVFTSYLDLMRKLQNAYCLESAGSHGVIMVLDALKGIEVEGIEEIALLEDQKVEGKIKGFAFVEFVTHIDTRAAFNRLPKPDAVLGCAFTAKVSFA